uniref:Photosystem I subunit VI n=1 Tax=Tetraselmis sp. GSL018 TaxID=582737 RepID=A0A061SLB4_9CHLO|mmetsp:Transcript_37307/g.88674  ORF Transcript_37307/g.88674 Transcript_37307/m.88674 type:complete len:134 (+) Transcript_37307:145-546(+)|eukprot:CAMPEP_0177582604 /NCGR_PEP_ID=MMETSP0419_2-20121207/2848_1 /TAXON_ID=582737 /ORGANISM="Tetraselmis sp., Strain GSL018" /LENGTH=133 /DNA_ID=CAMNT_0019071881 /DNA_START=98 /DNA_END=499 /DNA_ORIENTATION=-
MALSLCSAKSAAFVKGTSLRAHRPVQAQRPRARLVTRAKYGEDSKYFDLNDLENTLGAWDMYGQEDEKRYPAMQAEFFERAAAGLTRREAMLGFLAGTGGASILVWGGKGAKDAKLPITTGPKSSEPGPKGKL